MRLLSTLPLVLAATNTNTVVQASAPGNQQLRRRQTTLACDETYGEGFVRCGGPESEYCYNPSYGQTCCLAELGFCDVGYFCAPIGGLCCPHGGTSEECAMGVGFQVLESESDETDTDLTTVLKTTTMVKTVTLYPESATSTSPLTPSSSAAAPADATPTESPEDGHAAANATATVSQSTLIEQTLGWLSVILSIVLVPALIRLLQG